MIRLISLVFAFLVVVPTSALAQQGTRTSVAQSIVDELVHELPTSERRAMAEAQRRAARAPTEAVLLAFARFGLTLAGQASLSNSLPRLGGMRARLRSVADANAFVDALEDHANHLFQTSEDSPAGERQRAAAQVYASVSAMASLAADSSGYETDEDLEDAVTGLARELLNAVADAGVDARTTTRLVRDFINDVSAHAATRSAPTPRTQQTLPDGYRRAAF